jgi:CRISPR-associated endonuclease/helicase Cas3
MLSPASSRDRPDDQSLDDHVSAVETEARRIADALRLAEDDPIRIALIFAARWHDEGKKAGIWQRFVYGPDADGYKGKSSRTRDPKSLRGYRHEFGSLLRILRPDRCDTPGVVVPEDPGASELGLHLIATHHGMARPHFSTAVYDGFTDAERDALHANVIRRFARLQCK